MEKGVCKKQKISGCIHCTLYYSTLNRVYWDWGLNALNYENCGNQLKLIHIVH